MGVLPWLIWPYTVYESDDDAEYSQVVEYDISSLEPQVALPSSPANTKPVSQVGNIEIDQVVVGSCTNGRLGDLQIAAQILAGRKVHPRVRCTLQPAVPALGGTWEFWPPASGVSPLPTATLSAGWAALNQRSIYQIRLLPPLVP